jgi:hypothetical protein
MAIYSEKIDNCYEFNVFVEFKNTTWRPCKIFFTSQQRTVKFGAAEDHVVNTCTRVNKYCLLLNIRPTNINLNLGHPGVLLQLQ